MALSVKHLTLDFGPGHDLMVQEFEPRMRTTDSVEPAWDSLSPPFFLPLLRTSFPQINKLKKKQKKILFIHISSNVVPS